jgi:hypothetical protein
MIGLVEIVPHPRRGMLVHAISRVARRDLP